MKIPVVIFCYTRLHYLKKVIEALRDNPEAPDTELFIYSDGGKDEQTWQQVQIVRDYLYSISGFKKITVIEQKENKKLEYNVIQGITEVVNQFGKVIVLEDDILPSKSFLHFMNDALDYYENKKDVMSVSAYNFLKYPKTFPETFAWRFDGGWGWGTWKDRWDKFQHFQTKEEALSLLTPEEQRQLQFNNTFRCLDLLNFSPIPWDICWHISILKYGVGISLTHSLTEHIGVDGTHFAQKKKLNFLYKQPYISVAFSDKPVTFFTDDLTPNQDAEKLFERYHYYNGLSFWGRFLLVILNLVYPCLPAKLQACCPERCRNKKM